MEAGKSRTDRMVRDHPTRGRFETADLSDRSQRVKKAWDPRDFYFLSIHWAITNYYEPLQITSYILEWQKSRQFWFFYYFATPVFVYSNLNKEAILLCVLEGIFIFEYSRGVHLPGVCGTAFSKIGTLCFLKNYSDSKHYMNMGWNWWDLLARALFPIYNVIMTSQAERLVLWRHKSISYLMTS